jgi:hypothetical protein
MIPTDRNLIGSMRVKDSKRKAAEKASAMPAPDLPPSFRKLGDPQNRSLKLTQEFTPKTQLLRIVVVARIRQLSLGDAEHSDGHSKRERSFRTTSATSDDAS